MGVMPASHLRCWRLGLGLLYGDFLRLLRPRPHQHPLTPAAKAWASSTRGGRRWSLGAGAGVSRPPPGACQGGYAEPGAAASEGDP